MSEMVRNRGDQGDRAEKLSGIFKARVEYNKDPKRLGRVRVRVPSLHRDEKTGLKFNQLPWAYPCVPGIAGEDFGTFIVPPVGSFVWVMFEDKDPDKPVYLGSSYGRGASSAKVMNTFEAGDSVSMGQWRTVPGGLETPKDVFDGKNSNYPDRGVVFKSPKGHTILYDDTDGQESFSIIDRVGQIIKFVCPVPEGSNRGNASRRGTMDASRGQQVTLNDCHIDMITGDSMISISPERILLRVEGASVVITESQIRATAERIDLNE